MSNIRKIVLGTVLVLFGQRVIASTISNCMELVTYSGNYHLECTYAPCKGLDLVIDPIGNGGGWRFGVHHTRGWGYVAKSSERPLISYLDFSDKLYSVEYRNATEFYALFAWHETDQSDDYVGWIHMKEVDGDLTLVGCAIGSLPMERVPNPTFGTEDDSGIIISPTDTQWLYPEIAAKLRTSDRETLLTKLIGKSKLTDITFIHLLATEPCTDPADIIACCIKLGVSPVKIQKSGHVLVVTFQPPTIQLTDIDSATRTLRGKFIPAQGSQIVLSPQPYMIGLLHHKYLGTPSFYIKDLGYYWWSNEFNLDLSRYMEDGSFAISFPEWAAYPDEGFIFSVRVYDYDLER